MVKLDVDGLDVKQVNRQLYHFSISWPLLVAKGSGYGEVIHLCDMAFHMAERSIVAHDALI